MRRCLPILLMLATPAGAREVTCSVTLAGKTVAGPCLYQPRRNGSFDARMTDGRRIDGMETVTLDLSGAEPRITGKEGKGATRDWGAARRDPADRACWIGQDIRLCARAAQDGSDAATVDQPVRFAGRCHMDACTWVRQSRPQPLAEGSDSVPGRALSVMESIAITEHRGADYPDSAPADARWAKPHEVRYFCSMTRPAVQFPDQPWHVLPLPEVFGATEAATVAYLHVCHPDQAGGDPYETPARLGYKAGGEAGRTYPDFAALIAR